MPRMLADSRTSRSRTSCKFSGVAMPGTRISPSSPRVPTTSTTRHSSAYFASVPPVPKTSSSGWAKTATIVHGSLTSAPLGSLSRRISRLVATGLVEDLVEHDAGRDRQVERIAASDHWNADQQVAEREVGPRQPLPLAPHQQHQRPPVAHRGVVE